MFVKQFFFCEINEFSTQTEKCFSRIIHSTVREAILSKREFLKRCYSSLWFLAQLQFPGSGLFSGIKFNLPIIIVNQLMYNVTRINFCSGTSRETDKQLQCFKQLYSYYQFCEKKMEKNILFKSSKNRG